jgi:hypothetical protein
MNTILKFLSLVLIILFYGCDDNKNSNQTDFKEASYNVNLVESDEILQFKVDSETSNISDFLTYFGEDKKASLLFSLNIYIYELQIYDLTSGGLIKRIPLEMNGQRGVGPIKGVHVQSLDSIFLFPLHDNSVYISDTSGVKLDRIDYKTPNGYIIPEVQSTFFSAIPTISNNKLIVKTLYDGNYRQFTNETLSKKHVAYAIDLSTGETSLIPHYFPKDYWKGGMKHHQFSVTYSKNSSVYAFYGDHSLYYSNSITAKLQAKNVASKYLDKEIEIFPINGDREERVKYYSVSNHYGNIHYDKYRNVYYRFCYPRNDQIMKDDLMKNAQFPELFSIMILDKDLNIIGETLFDHNKEFVPKNVFVGLDGLYVSINHPDNPKNQEDYFSFKLLTLQ